MSVRRPFTVHEGVAAPMLVDNIDTDQIIPSREMKAVSREGLGEGLFAGQRYLSSSAREPNPDFVLNKDVYRGASILLAGANFGCGSSREHAVWALAEFGVRAIIAKSFGEIFHGNCARNGVLPIALGRALIETLAGHVRADPQTHRLCIDLENQTVSATMASDMKFSFEVDPYQKRLLSGGLDPIGLTLERRDEIAAFIERDRGRRPWIYE